MDKGIYRFTRLFAAFASWLLCLQLSARTVTCLSGDGWTFDGNPVSVPHTWNAIDAADGKNTLAKNPGTSVGSPSYARGAHTYGRNLPDPRLGKRYFLRLEGVSSKCEVWVNESLATSHYGAFTAFACEITDMLKPSGNELRIVADNSYDRDVPPISGDFSMFGGVYRDVWLIETDPICINPLVYGGSGVVLEPNPATGHVVARISVLGGEDEVQEFDFPNPRLWSPETPNLYELTLRIERSGSRDEVKESFGFRTVEFRTDGFYLNGHRRQLHGVNKHQDRDGKGWAVSAGDLAEDVDWIKRMGADAVRTAHYPHSTEFYRLCDTRGLLVWTELPLIDELSFSDAFRSNALVMAREMIAQHRNHPSVVMWGLYNEIFGEGGKAMPMEPTVALLKEIHSQIKRDDASRPTVSAGCDALRRPIYDITDVQGFNLYPGWYNLEPWYAGDGGWDLSNAVRRVLAEMPTRRMIAVSEFGCGASVNQHGDPFARPRPNLDPYPEEYQAYLHAGALHGVQGNPLVWGIFPWVMFDLAADRRHEADRHGINNKGLVTYDRKTAKDAFYLYKANWNPEPELRLVGSRMTTLTNETVNVMAFSNVGNVTLSVNGCDIGVAVPDRVKTCYWRDVPLVLGPNRIEVRAGGLSRTAVWTRVLAKAFVLGETAVRDWVARFNADDEEIYTNAVSNAEAADFLVANVPRFECPDRDLERVYYFRWWTFRKHLRRTPSGWVVTEFLPDVPWAGKYNTISCPFGHHLREGRWLRNRTYLDDYTRIMLEEGAVNGPRAYACWPAWATMERRKVTGDDGFSREMLPLMVRNYEAWERGWNLRLWTEEPRRPFRAGYKSERGLFDLPSNYEGSEFQLSAEGARPLVNAAMWAEAMAIAEIAGLSGENALSVRFRGKADALAKNIMEKQWNRERRFFTVFSEQNVQDSVCELHGYAPFYFGMPLDESYDAAWARLMSPRGFWAPKGLTFPARDTPGFDVEIRADRHMCLWNGPSWPYATSLALTALYRRLHRGASPSLPVGKKDFVSLLRQYAAQHVLRREDGRVVSWIDEDLHPFTGEWIARRVLLEQAQRSGRTPKVRERGKDYNHSTFCDLVIEGLCGVEPQRKGPAKIKPLAPPEWDWWCIDGIRYHGGGLTVLFDRDGRRYGKGKGLVVIQSPPDPRQ